MNYEELVSPLKDIAYKAGNLILNVYKSDFKDTIETKADKSPVTKADNLSNNYIVRKLKALFPHIPIISEESEQISYNLRKEFDLYWLVDPLDGTKEFIKKNDEFTVNIALIKGNYPVIGVVYAPVFNEMFYGVQGKGAFKEQSNNISLLQCKAIGLVSENFKVLVSRSHLTKKDLEYIKTFNHPTIQNMGSSLKFMRIAEGEADIYFRHTPTMEWDTAASQIILEESGGEIIDLNTGGIRLRYNKPSLINSGFIARNKVLKNV